MKNEEEGMWRADSQARTEGKFRTRREERLDMDDRIGSVLLFYASQFHHYL